MTIPITTQKTLYARFIKSQNKGINQLCQGLLKSRSSKVNKIYYQENNVRVNEKNQSKNLPKVEDYISTIAKYAQSVPRDLKTV